MAESIQTSLPIPGVVIALLQGPQRAGKSNEGAIEVHFVASPQRIGPCVEVFETKKRKVDPKRTVWFMFR